MSPFVSRAYRPDDLEACLAVFDTNVPDFFRPHERTEFETFLAALPGPYLVLLDADGAVVACGGYALNEGGRRADLCWGMVRRDLHGSGLGRLLTESRVQNIRGEQAAREIALNTSQLTVGFYERMGFRLLGVEPDGYSPGLDRCEMLLTISEEGDGSGRR